MRDDGTGEERTARGGPLLAVIFDMDGLMLDTERPAVRLWREASAEQGWDLDEAIPISTIGLDEKDTEKRMLEACGSGFPYDLVRRRVGELYVDHMERNGIAHRPGLVALLDHLAALGVPLGVATSTPKKAAIWKLELAGIRDRFSALACGDEVRKGKPAPDIFLLAAERLGFAPETCVGFEDSAAGLRGLASAGIRSVFVKDLLEPPEDVLATVWKRRESLAAAVDLFAR